MDDNDAKGTFIIAKGWLDAMFPNEEAHDDLVVSLQAAFDALKRQSPLGFPTKFPGKCEYDAGFNVEVSEERLQRTQAEWSHVTFQTCTAATDEWWAGLGVHGPVVPGTMVTQYPSRPERVNVRSGMILAVERDPLSNMTSEVTIAWNPWTARRKDVAWVPR